MASRTPFSSASLQEPMNASKPSPMVLPRSSSAGMPAPRRIKSRAASLREMSLARAVSLSLRARSGSSPRTVSWATAIGALLRPRRNLRESCPTAMSHSTSQTCVAQVAEQLAGALEPRSSQPPLRAQPTGDAGGSGRGENKAVHACRRGANAARPLRSRYRRWPR